MRPEHDGEVPPLREGLGEAWRALEPPEGIRRQLHQRLEGGALKERLPLRNTVLALAAILLVVVAGSLWEREKLDTAAGLRLDLRSGRLHLVWFQAGQAGESR